MSMELRVIIPKGLKGKHFAIHINALKGNWAFMGDMQVTSNTSEVNRMRKFVKSGKVFMNRRARSGCTCVNNHVKGTR